MLATSLETPVATVIFVVTIAISLISLFRAPQIINRYVMRPYLVARGKNLETVITSGFLHGDIGHLAFNMFTFYFFAFELDRFLGPTKFAILYIAGLIVSSACSVRKHRDNAAYATLGASGAISAVLFAYIVYSPLTTLIIFPIPIPIPAIVFAIGYVAYSWWSAKQARGNINHDAHLCGAITGVLFVAFTDPVAFQRLTTLF
jgi:membrane associated rhomboid family serine protease